MDVTVAGNRFSTVSINTTGIESVIYYTSDPVGSATLAYKEDGTLLEYQDTNPYGDIRSSLDNPTITTRYALHDRSDATGLVDMEARYYDPLSTQFTAQDPMATYTPEQFVLDPQQLHTYAYARNNPVKYNDPTGMRASLKSVLSSSFSSLKNGVGRLWGKVVNGGGEQVGIVFTKANYKLSSGGSMVVNNAGLDKNGSFVNKDHSTATSFASANNLDQKSSGNCSSRGSSSCTSFESIRVATLLNAVALQQNCNCGNLTITGGTEVGHSTSKNNTGHYDGFKYDLSKSSNRNFSQISTYIEGNYAYSGTRSDGAVMYTDSLGNNYSREHVGESNEHWDVRVPNTNGLNYQFSNMSN
jgi:RHS repeat-associated protein